MLRVEDWVRETEGRNAAGGEACVYIRLINHPASSFTLSQTQEAFHRKWMVPSFPRRLSIPKEMCKRRNSVGVNNKQPFRKLSLNSIPCSWEGCSYYYFLFFPKNRKKKKSSWEKQETIAVVNNKIMTFEYQIFNFFKELSCMFLTSIKWDDRRASYS